MMGIEGAGSSKGTRIEDSWAWPMGGLTEGVGADEAGESNGEKGRTIVTEQ